MEIKDYLHLYLGCPCKGKEGSMIYTLVGVDTEQSPRLKDKHGNSCIIFDFKPILRPLSDISEEDLKEIFLIAYKSVYDHEPFDDSQYYFIDNVQGAGLKFRERVNEKTWEYGLTVNNDQVLFSANGNFLNVPQFQLSIFLLSKHFDLFGLIDAGLAIDATTHHPSLTTHK